MKDFHIPVMFKEVIHYLSIKPGKWYIDCNLGGGGHTQGILEKGGKILGIDLDPEAIREVAKNYSLEIKEIDGNLEATSDQLILYQSNFNQLEKVVQKFQISPVLGILFDLGVSSYQLETAERGFSFNLEAPLDMRMNPNIGATAADLINGLYENELAEIFSKYGEERFARPIARKIVEERQKKPITTTNQLAQIILSVRHRSSKDRTHPATRVFQALRIAVNDELTSLEQVLPQALDVLAPGGKLVVISFHSLEDRIVKNFMQDEYKKGSITIITQKPVEPEKKEIVTNPRSRSGKLRVTEKL
ncbi:MAG: 16S rRNA (cytosine(1402)-N(4))-methyltransferase RsmH [Candidatus Daviesbacteria bacterium]